MPAQPPTFCERWKGLPLPTRLHDRRHERRQRAAIFSFNRNLRAFWGANGHYKTEPYRPRRCDVEFPKSRSKAAILFRAFFALYFT